MEEPTLAARNLLMAILPHFLHFMVFYCKSVLNHGKTYWKFTKSSLSYRKKSVEPNGRTYTGRTKRSGDYFTPILLFHDILL